MGTARRLRVVNPSSNDDETSNASAEEEADDDEDELEDDDEDTDDEEDDDDDDDDEDAEDADDEGEDDDGEDESEEEGADSGRAAAPKAPPLPASQPSSPSIAELKRPPGRPRGSGTKQVKIPGRGLDPWSPPPECAFTKVLRARTAPGSVGMDTCAFHMVDGDGMVRDRLAPKTVTPASVLANWGSGTYQVFFYGADGKVLGRPSPVTLARPQDPELPHIRVVRKTPAPAPPPPPPVESTPRAPAPPPLPQLPPMKGLGQLGLQEFLGLQAYFEAKNYEQLLRNREEYELRLSRIRADHEMTLRETEARHRRRMEEDDARHRRDMEHFQSLSKTLIEASEEARDVDAIHERLDEVEERAESAAQHKPEGAKEIIDALAPVVAPIVQNFVNQRKGPVSQ